MQNENPTTLSSERHAQQGTEEQSNKPKHSTHQHHHESDPVMGSFIGAQESSGEQREGEDQQVPESSSLVDKSSIFDRDASKDEPVSGDAAKDESEDVQDLHGMQDWTEEQRQAFYLDQSSRIRHHTMTSDVNKQSTDLSRLSSGIGKHAHGKRDEAADLGLGQQQQQQQQQQHDQSASSSSSQDAKENWAHFPEASDLGDASKQRDWAIPADVTDKQSSAQLSGDAQKDWAIPMDVSESSRQDKEDKEDKDWSSTRSTEGSQASFDLQGVDKSQWPQNQGIWNPALQGDSAAADKSIAQQFEGSSLSDQSGVTRDQGPYGMDIQGQQGQQGRDEEEQGGRYAASSDEPLSSWPKGQSSEAAKWPTNWGSQAISDQGQQDLGESRKYESSPWGSGSAEDLGGSRQAAESNVHDFGKGDLGEQSGRIFGDSSADAGAESNVRDFGRGDLGEQSKLVGDKSTFAADAEEQPDWSQRKNTANSGDDRVHGMAQEDFI